MLLRGLGGDSVCSPTYFLRCTRLSTMSGGVWLLEFMFYRCGRGSTWLSHDQFLRMHTSLQSHIYVGIEGILPRKAWVRQSTGGPILMAQSPLYGSHGERQRTGMTLPRSQVGCLFCGWLWGGPHRSLRDLSSAGYGGSMGDNRISPRILCLCEGIQRPNTRMASEIGGREIDD